MASMIMRKLTKGFTDGISLVMDVNVVVIT